MSAKKEVSPVDVSLSQIEMVHVPILALMDAQCFAEDLCWSADLFASVLETGGWGYFLMCKESPIGFHLCRSVVGETEILTLGILPAFQGRKLGKFLIDSILTGAKNRQAEEIFLEVEESNLPALALYKKAGFQILGRRPDYYGKGRDAFVMGFKPALPE